jgi:CheY-like chemotaxis protein
VPESCFNTRLINLVEQTNDVASLFSLFKKEEPETGKIRYTLQLGSGKYPFIKIAYQKSDKGDFGFLVDRHTEYMKAETSSETFNQEVDIKDYTKKLKMEIENKWEENNIPTYRNIVRQETEKENRKKRDLQISKLGLSVLLVEDDPDIGNLHKLKMELLGYDVTLAENGEVALELLKKKNFHVMVLDLMMPSISGFEVIKKVYDKIPIVVLSAISDKMTINTCLKDGAKAFLIKPVTSDVLDHTLKNVIENDLNN